MKPIYVLYGDDSFLRDLHRAEVVAEAIGDAEPQTCVTSFDATVELAAVLDEVRTLPFLAPCRVVIVRDADAFVSANREALEAYLERPARNGTLLLFVSSWPKNTKLFKIVAKVGQAFDCTAPQGRDLTARLEKAFAKEGKKIARPAAEMLVAWVGSDLGTLNQEIQKLATYVGSRLEVTEADVSAVVTSSAGPDAFDLTNAITEGNAAAALRALDGMLAARGEEFRTLGLLGWHLRRAVSAQEAIRSGQRPDAAVPPMPYPQKNAFISMLRRRPPALLHQDFRRLIAADLAMKSGAEPKAAMQDLVVALCR